MLGRLCGMRALRGGFLLLRSGFLLLWLSAVVTNFITTLTCVQ